MIFLITVLNFISIYLWASLIIQLVKNLCLQCRRLRLDSWVRKIPWRRDRLPTPVFLGFPGGSGGKVCLQCGRPGFDHWVGKIPWWEGMVSHSSILAWRIPIDRGDWQATIHGVTELDMIAQYIFIFLCICYFHPLIKL